MTAPSDSGSTPSADAFLRSALGALVHRTQGIQALGGIYQDAMAEQFLGQLSLNPAHFENRSYMFNVAVRTVILDEIVSEFIRRCPGSLVVNFGAGFCTRYYRLSAESTFWAEVDLPAVMEVRRSLNEPASERHSLIDSSVFHSDCMESLNQPQNGQVLVIAEGVFMYLSKRELRALCTRLQEAFSDVELVFEAISPALLRWKRVKGERLYQSALHSRADLQALHPRLRLVKEHALTARFQELQPFWRRVLNYMPSIQTSAKIIHSRFE